MKELTEYEWAVLGEIARSLVENLEDGGFGYYTTGTTLVKEEVKLLKKLAK